MAKYVEAEMVHNSLRSLCDKYKIAFGTYGRFGEELAKLSQELPAADVEPLKHGKWEECATYKGEKYYRCSACGYGYRLYENTRYCQHCGAKMDLNEEDK